MYKTLWHRLKYPYDSGLHLTTCTVVPMFYDCGELQNNSNRLKQLRSIRQEIRKKEKPVQMSENQINNNFWRKEYKIHNLYERGNITNQ